MLSQVCKLLLQWAVGGGTYLMFWVKEGDNHVGQELGSPKESKDYTKKTTETSGVGAKGSAPSHMDFCEALSCARRTPLGKAVACVGRSEDLG